MWEDNGCVKSPLTTDTTLVCTCNHATTFSIGVINLEVNTVHIPTNIDPYSVGLIVSAVSVAGLVLIYIVLASFALWKDRQDVLTSKIPTAAELRDFGLRYRELFGSPVPASVLFTVPHIN